MIGSIILLKQNANELEDMIKLAEDLGLKWQVGMRIVPTRDGSKAPLDHRPTLEQFRLALRVIRGYSPREEHRIELPQQNGRLLQQGGPICNGGITTCAISYTGEVLVCPGFPLSAGNVRERPFMEIWRSSDILKRVRNLRIKDIEKCKQCDNAVKYCTLCPALFLAEEGSLYKPSPRVCSETNIIKEEVSKDEKAMAETDGYN